MQMKFYKFLLGAGVSLIASTGFAVDTGNYRTIEAAVYPSDEMFVSGGRQGADLAAAKPVKTADLSVLERKKVEADLQLLKRKVFAKKTSATPVVQTVKNNAVSASSIPSSSSSVLLSDVFTVRDRSAALQDANSLNGGVLPLIAGAEDKVNSVSLSDSVKIIAPESVILSDSAKTKAENSVFLAEKQVLPDGSAVYIETTARLEPDGESVFLIEKKTFSDGSSVFLTNSHLIPQRKEALRLAERAVFESPVNTAYLTDSVVITDEGNAKKVEKTVALTEKGVFATETKGGSVLAAENVRYPDNSVSMTEKGVFATRKNLVSNTPSVLLSESAHYPDNSVVLSSSERVAAEKTLTAAADVVAVQVDSETGAVQTDVKSDVTVPSVSVTGGQQVAKQQEELPQATIAKEQLKKVAMNAKVEKPETVMEVETKEEIVVPPVPKTELTEKEEVVVAEPTVSSTIKTTTLKSTITTTNTVDGLPAEKIAPATELSASAGVVPAVMTGVNATPVMLYSTAQGNMLAVPVQQASVIPAVSFQNGIGKTNVAITAKQPAAPIIAVSATGETTPVVDNEKKESELDKVLYGEKVQDWDAKRGDTLRRLLTEGGAKAGWTVVWKLDRDYNLEAGVVLRGTFVDVSGALVRTFARATPPPNGTFYKGNRVLVVSSREEENGY